MGSVFGNIEREAFVCGKAEKDACDICRQSLPTFQDGPARTVEGQPFNYLRELAYIRFIHNEPYGPLLCCAWLADV